MYLNKFKGDNARLMRWALGLQAFHFQIVHINGRDNVGADFLSGLLLKVTLLLTKFLVFPSSILDFFSSLGRNEIL